MLTIVCVLAAMAFTGLGVAVFDYLTSRPQPIIEQPSTTVATNETSADRPNNTPRSIQNVVPYAEAGPFFGESNVVTRSNEPPQEEILVTVPIAHPEENAPNEKPSAEEVQRRADFEAAAAPVREQFGNVVPKENTIGPFSNLTWDDDVVTLAEKLLARSDVEQFTIQKPAAGLRPKRVFGRISKQDTETIKESIQQILAQHVHGFWYADQGFSVEGDTALQLNLEHPHIEGDIEVIASPIVIGRGIFSLTVNFSACPGQLVLDPQQAVNRAERLFNKKNLYSSLCLTSANLDLVGFTDEKSTVKQVVETVRASLQENYKSFRSKRRYIPHRRILHTTTWSDGSHEVSLTERDVNGKSTISIVYTDQERPARFRRAREQFEANLKKIQDERRVQEHQQKFGELADSSDQL